ncbi:potassium channel family protein [Vibrio mediterranei]|uniref:potassium channel family protein n=1 Tax=Vibrio mediterranei TaxID=689 RepID=UPI00406899DF
MNARDRRIKKSKTQLIIITVSLCFAVGFSFPLYWIEKAAGNPGITTLSDAFYLNFITQSTIGYGDKLPTQPESRALLIAGYFLTRISLILVIFSTGRTLLGSRKKDELQLDDRITVIDHDLKQIHSELYELNREFRKELKHKRRSREKAGEFQASCINSLIDLTNSQMCRRTHIHCLFDLSDLYQEDPELWLSIKRKAIANGAHSISFTDGNFVRMSKQNRL